MQINEGITIAGEVKIPAKCNKDQFCQILQNFFGKNYQINVKGHVSSTSISLQATIAKTISIFRGVPINGVGFKVESGISTHAISLPCTVNFKFPYPPFTFIGSFGVSNKGVFLQMSTKGWWDYVFGLPYLRLGNLHFKVAIPAAPHFTITQLEFGCMAQIGYRDALSRYLGAVPLEASLCIGMDIIDPYNNYFLGNISSLTVPSLFKAFAWKPSFPKVIADIGFPRGAHDSFALRARRLPNGIVIPQGLHFKGVMKILNFEMQGDVRSDMFKGTFIEGVATGFTMGSGLISGSNFSVQVNIPPWPRAPSTNIAGVITVLGMTSPTDLLVDHTGLQLR